MFKRLTKSIAAAGRGLKFVFRSQYNFRAQTAAGVIVFALSIIFPLARWERILILLLILMVLVMEILNTALEYFNDLLKPRLHHYVRDIKDATAGAVLLTALFAAVIGLMIFIPHFINLVR
ncbi:diacylglycerol kinase [Patescibacteria group bacterium]|nr:MAG: diacylglycerol kinase [Patescibacteria group bacterium]